MRFVVTGAGGFLGSNVVRHLLAHTYHEVLAVTSKSPSELQRLLDLVPVTSSMPDTTPQCLSPADLISQGALVPGDVVVNAAFPWNRGGQAMASGLKFAMATYRLAAEQQVRSFLNVSSQSVYSQARDEPAHEGSTVECDTPYSTAKYALELASAEVIGPDRVSNLRLSSLIGVGYEIRVVNRLIQQVIDRTPLVVKGGGQSFDFMDVRDAAQALVTVGETGILPGSEVLNIGASNLLTLSEMVRVITEVAEEELGMTPEVHWTEDNEDHRRLALDTSLLKLKYGFEPAVSFEESVRAIMRSKVSA